MSLANPGLSLARVKEEQCTLGQSVRNYRKRQASDIVNVRFVHNLHNRDNLGPRWPLDSSCYQTICLHRAVHSVAWVIVPLSPGSSLNLGFLIQKIPPGRQVTMLVYLKTNKLTNTCDTISAVQISSLWLDLEITVRASPLSKTSHLSKIVKLDSFCLLKIQSFSLLLTGAGEAHFSSTKILLCSGAMSSLLVQRICILSLSQGPLSILPWQL